MRRRVAMSFRGWAAIAAGLLLLAYISTGFVLIRPGERAVVRRFGRVLENKPGPGLWIGLPWGIDRVDRVPIAMVRRLEVGYQPDAETPSGQLLTGDHNLVNIRVVLNYAVEPSDRDGYRELVNYVLNRDRTDDFVGHAVENYLAEWVASRRIDDLLIHGKSELPLALAAHLPARINSYHLGIRIQDVSVAHLLPPEEVKPAFDEVTRAQTAIQTSEYRAQQEAARIVQEAQGRKYTTVEQARAYADTQLRLASADARRFDERRRQYWKLRDKNPNALAAIWWDEMGRILSRMKDAGRLDLLDHHLAGDGLDITMSPVLPKRR